MSNGPRHRRATQCKVKKSVASKLLEALAAVGTQEVKKTGVFTVPGLARMKIRNKPATKAGKREVFGKIVMAKAKPARKIDNGDNGRGRGVKSQCRRG